MTRPSLKQVREILGQKVTGRNDARIGGGRIKLDINLERAQEVDLENKLSCLYPSLIITVADDVLRNKYGEDVIVTVINYRDLNVVKERKQQPPKEEVVEPSTPEPSVQETLLKRVLKQVLQFIKNPFK